MKMIKCEVIKPFSTYLVGSVLESTRGVADVYVRRGFVKIITDKISKKEEKPKRRGRPRKK